MASLKKEITEWRQFEQLVARIEADSDPQKLKITSPDRLRCKTTGRLREVDVSIRSQIGTSSILITIECRKRSAKQDVTWIEQLATKKQSIGADRTIAVSSSGFSQEAEVAARHYGIDLRRISDVSISEINKLIRLDFVLFTHKKCSVYRVGVRLFQSLDWIIPEFGDVDMVLPSNTDLFLPIFENIETGYTWSLNDLWLQLQEATDPFSNIQKGQPPEIRTSCFPYPGNVTMDTPDGKIKIGDVLLSLALSLEVEKVDLESATKIEYTSPDNAVTQRVEFSSDKPGKEDWRISLQAPKGTENINQVKMGGSWPDGK